MFIGILALITALAISAVAIYYSVAGLVAIFAAAAIPIMIMGGVLEVSKLVTTVWLHRNWNLATWWLKTYLSTAVVVLMFITSMGIFGFLSKAHIEQTAGVEQDQARIEQITERIEYNTSVIESAENKINELQNSGSTMETNIRDQVEQAQDRIDTAYDRVKPAIQEQRELIARQTNLYQTQIDTIDENLQELNEFIRNDEIRKAQAIVGTVVDGVYGTQTAEAFRNYQQAQEQKRDDLVSKLETSLNNNSIVQRARSEIENLQQRADRQVADATATIERLRSRLNNSTDNNIETLIEQQNQRIQEAGSQVETLTDTKFELESSYRELEAEVGPLRFIAEFVYGDQADAALLEKAVQWIILIIIFVFDPLAVLLLIASQYSIEGARTKNRRKEDFMAEVTSEGDPMNPDNRASQKAFEKIIDIANTRVEEEANEEESEEQDKKDEEYNPERAAQYAEKEKNEEFVNKKTQWKTDHPDETLKHYKRMYINGTIDSLPWE